jgi:hypothetical protein
MNKKKSTSEKKEEKKNLFCTTDINIDNEENKM